MDKKGYMKTSLGDNNMGWCLDSIKLITKIVCANYAVPSEPRGF